MALDERDERQVFDRAEGQFEAQSDDRRFRDRVAENPRPALVWAGGAGLLLALELGRFAGGLRAFGGIVQFLYESVAFFPGWIGGNVTTTFGPTAGTVAFTLTALCLLALLSGPITVRLHTSPVDALGVPVPTAYKHWAERAIVTLAIGAAFALVAWTPAGAVYDAAVGALLAGIDLLSELPVLTSRETIPNQGHRMPGGGWDGPFLGLSPAQAWALRVLVVFGYAAVLLAWTWRGYDVYREHYRGADWTPRDDTVDRFVSHRWGSAGLVIVTGFFVFAIWAPALTSVPVEHNHYQPYQHEVTYLTDDGELATISHGEANIDSRSNGASNVAPLTYDEYGRWAPAGTNSDGKDLFTFIVYGARTSLVIGLLSVILGAGFALALAMITAYYKGLVDIVAIFASDTVQGVPQFLLILILMVILSEANHPIVTFYDGAILLALIFGFTLWPGLWRSIRGPSLQVTEEEWVDAAKSYGQRATVIMRKHMAPYVLGYLLIYASLILGTTVIQTAALSFLGIGINPPTPEWGRMIADGRPFVSTKSWHIATIMGFLIVLVVTGFNALGDAIRDAIDMEATLDEESGGGT